MKLITKSEKSKLLENGKPENHGKDHLPVVKLVIKGFGSLVLTELSSKNPSLAYGLCDIASDFCKLTQFDLDTFGKLAEENGVKIERVENFAPKSPISVYESAARKRRTKALVQSFFNR